MTDNERTDRERVEVTQADRIAAAPMAVLAEMRDLILAGKADHYAKPFARHREQALRAALEEAARLADAVAAEFNSHDDHEEGLCADGAKEAAAAIRKRLEGVAG